MKADGICTRVIPKADCQNQEWFVEVEGKKFLDRFGPFQSQSDAQSFEFHAFSARRTLYPGGKKLNNDPY